MPLQPENRSLWISRPLTNISVAYQQGQGAREYIASQVFPIVTVQQQGGLYWKYNKGDWFRGEAELRAPATESTGGGWNVSTSSYYANVYAVHKDVDDQTRANADAGGQFNLDRDAALWVTQNLLQKRDSDFVSTYMKAAVWSNDVEGVAATPSTGQTLQWNVSGSDPVADINKMIITIAKSTGYRPNTLVVGPSVWNELLNNAAILSRIKYSGGNGGIITEQILAQLFNVSKFVVAWTIQNTADEGAADSFSFMTDKGALLVYSPPTPSMQSPAGGYIFSWAGFLGASGAFGTRVRNFRMENIQSDRVEGEMAYTMKIISADVGCFYKTIVA